MSTLATLSSDCISYLLEYISSNEIHSLLGTGNGLLRHKVVRNVTDLKLRLRHNENFPFSALKLPHLRSLSVSCFYLSYLHFEEAENTESSSIEGGKPRFISRLTSLTLHFANTVSLFAIPGVPFLGKRFPSLTELNLWAVGTENVSSSFEMLPETLKKFNLVVNSVPLELPGSMPFLALSKLPRSLIRLSLSWIPICEPENAYEAKNSEFSAILPPNLTYLSLSSLKGCSIMSCLPNSIESLHLFLSDAGGAKMKNSLLPKNLTTLRVNFALLFDVPLPKSITTLNMPNSAIMASSKPDNNDSNQKTVSSSSEDPIAILNSFSSNTVANIESQEQLDALLSSKKEKFFVKEIFLQKNGLRISQPLPSSIKILRMKDMIPGEDFAMLPSHLESFKLLRDLIPAQGPLVPFWNIEQVSMFPKYLRTLHLPFDVVDDGAKLAPISNLPLDSLELMQVPPEQLEIASTWLSACIPFYLKTFTLAMTYQMSLSEKISPDSVRLCDLGAAAPYLERIYMEVPFHNEAPMGPLFASLPQKKLLSLTFRSMAYVFEPSAMASLPSCLEQLSFVFYYTSDMSRGCLTNEHFEGLQNKKIVEIRMTPPSNRTLDVQVLQYLPNTLAYCHFNGTGIEASKLNRAIKQKIDARNSCPKHA